MKKYIKNNNDKLLFFGMIFACIFLSIVFMLLAKTSSKGTQYLNNDEILHYTKIAENILKDETYRPSDSNLQYKLDGESITIYSYNIFKQSVTLSFKENKFTTTINTPDISYTSCTIFFFILGIIAIIGAIWFSLVTIYEFLNPKIKNNNLSRKHYEKEIFMD